MKYNIELDISVGTSHSLILSRIRPESKVLEFGPASGYMTRYMKEELGCEIYGVEIDEAAAKYAEQYAEKMIVGDIENLNWYQSYKNEQFDFIIFADVLEHLRNPSHILKTVVSLLKDDGEIITSVPNISHNAIIMELMQGKFEYQPTGLLDETHIKFFTRNNVLKMLEYAGLSPKEWLVTQRRPETTEFKQDFRYFPKEIGEYLKTRPDADVYQFVTVSCKNEFMNNEVVFHNEYTNYLDSDYIQIFWGSTVSFSEENSIRAVHQDSDDIVSYKLEFPLEAQGKLRIDIASRLAWGEIHSIDIYSKENNSIAYSWDKDSTSLSFYNTSYTQHNKFIDFIVKNNDPNLIINDFLLEKSDSNWCIEIKMRIKNDLTEVLNNLMNKLDHHNIKAQENKLIIEKEVAINEERKQRIEQLEKEIAYYDQQVLQYKQVEGHIISIFETMKQQRFENIERTAEIIIGVSKLLEPMNEITTSLAENKYELALVKEVITKPNILKRIYKRLRK